jgi:hypothetical protein
MGSFMTRASDGLRRQLVRVPPLSRFDPCLGIGAKNLFLAAKIVWHDVPPSRGEREAIRAVVFRRAAVPTKHARP